MIIGNANLINGNARAASNVPRIKLGRANSNNIGNLMNKKFNKFNTKLFRMSNPIVFNKFNNDEITNELNISNKMSGNANKYGRRSARLKIHNGNVTSLCNNPGIKFITKLKILNPSNSPNANNLNKLGIICPRRFEINLAGIAANNPRPKLSSLLNNPSPNSNGAANNNSGSNNNGRSGINGINGNNAKNKFKIGNNN